MVSLTISRPWWKLSIKVVHMLIEAVVLCFLVMFGFAAFCYTIILMIVVPGKRQLRSVQILNCEDFDQTATMFGMVLAIGILG